MLPLIALFALGTLQAGSAAPDTLRPSDAYHDAAAQGWIDGARARSRAADRSIEAYTAQVQERFWAGLRTLGRDRTLVSMQTAARVEWNRSGPARVTVTGSRTIGPDGDPEVSSPRDRYPAAFVYTPGEDALVLRLTDSSWVRHPLAPGSEQFYRFRTGATTTITLPNSRAVRVVEIQVEPRRHDAHLIRGSLWLDADTYGPVRMVFRPAAPLVVGLGGSVSHTSDGRREISVNGRSGTGRGGLLGAEARGEVRYVTVEYGLHEGRWWRLRSLALEAVGRGKALGLAATVPVRWERAYSDYTVTGRDDDIPATGSPEAVASASAPGNSCPSDSSDLKAACRCTGGVCRIVQVEIPTDTAALLASEDLPPPFAESGARTLSGTDTDQILGVLRRAVPPVWALESPRIRPIIPGPGTLRYNRVEGLSVGAGMVADFGAAGADATLRIGTADREMNAELRLTRATGSSAYRIAGFRRLAAVDPAARPFGLGNSLGALLWGRDHGDYFRTAGIELLGEPAVTERPWYEWRVFAEQQSGAERNAEFSIRDALGNGSSFRPNIDADRANQLGGSFALRAARGLELAGPRAGAELFVEGATGTYGFVRPRLLLSGGAPLPGRLFGSLETAVGTSVGDVPAQSLWYLGGPATLRGYDGNADRGEAFWRARGEIANRGPLTRLGIFADAGWAGAREQFTDGRPLVTVGAGASLLDGWLRFDVARALVAPTGWSVYLSVNSSR